MGIKAVLLGAGASIALAGTASAGGWYVAGEAGINAMEDTHGVLATLVPFSSGETSFDDGWAVLATVGYGMEGNWRLELEGGYRSNDVDGGSAEVTQWSLMMNALYDFELSSSLDLSIGGGIGFDYANIDFAGLLDDSDSNFAYQGIAGLSFEIGPQTDLTLTYRYMNVTEPEFGAFGFTLSYDDVTQHTLTVGIRHSLSSAE